MALSRVLWTTLSGCVILVVMMIGSWMMGINAQIMSLETRANTSEQHWAAIDQDLRDLREDMHQLLHKDDK